MTNSESLCQRDRRYTLSAITFTMMTDIGAMTIMSGVIGGFTMFVTANIASGGIVIVDPVGVMIG